MYVPLQVSVFFPLLFFLKVSSPALMVCVLISFYKFFSFCFHMKKESPGVEEFQFVYVEHKQRQNRGFPCNGKQFSPYDQIHG